MPQFRGPARYSFVAFRLTPVFLPYGFQFLGIGSGHGGLLSVFDAIQFQELIKSQRGVLLQCLFDRFGSVFPQCGLMVFPGVVIVSR